MAIDDNTSYELTGYQVKDLAQKIRGKADDDVFVGAGTSVAGSRGLVPAPAAGDNEKFLSGDGTWKALANIVYPVGSIYMSATMSTVAQVQTALGGTWVKWGAGRVPVGVDTTQTEFKTVGKTGGEKTHTLTIDEMPKHSHSYKWLGGSGTESGIDESNGNKKWWGNNLYSSDTGGNQAHNNLPPYITCYMYKRTA